MPATTKHSSSLTARQRARQATEAQEAKLKERQKKLESAFSAIDEKSAAEIKLGAALIELKKLGGNNSSIADELDLSSRDVSNFIALADSIETDETSEDEEPAGTSEQEDEHHGDRGDSNAAPVV